MLASPRTAELGSDPHVVPIGELLTERFLSKHTSFSNVEEFLRASRLDTEQLVELGPRSGALWDHFVRASSGFPDWQSLLREARSEWLIRRLGLTPRSTVDPLRQQSYPRPEDPR
jgi:hypothetical protein